MHEIYESVYNAEICLAPRRLDFGSGAAARMRPGIGFCIFDVFTIDLAFCLKIWKNMQKVYKSVYNAEICLAPRRLDFGSGAAARMRPGIHFFYFRCFFGKFFLLKNI